MSKKHVVIGLKEKQPVALKFAVQAAVARRGELRVVHCLDIRSAGDFVSTPRESWYSAGEELIEEAKRIIELLAPDLRTEYVTDARAPFFALREEAEGADLIVVGPDAGNWTYRFFNGSVTERIVMHSPVPVAVVAERSWEGEPFGVVAVALDTKSPASAQLRHALEEAQRRNSELHVFHVVTDDDHAEASMPARVELAEVLAGWAEEFPDVRISRQFYFDDADAGCMRASAEADLLVLGRETRSRLALPGSHPVLSRVSKFAPCPCMVVPSHETLA